MTARERKLVVAAGVAGFLVAAALFALVAWKETRPAQGEMRAETLAETPAADHSAHAAPQSSGGELATVELTDEEQRAIGVQTAEVRRIELRDELLAVGRVEEAETNLASISARVGGRIDKLYVNFTGQPVRRGQAIALIYSPEVVSSAEEYKLALENQARLGERAHPQARAQANDLVAASRRRLELWGLRGQQIEALGSAAEPTVHITVHSPASGTITERRVVEGQYVREGDVLYTVSDLSMVWVLADVYEADLPGVRMGQAVEITAEALPGTKLRGTVSFVDPVLRPETRTVGVRVQVSNPGMRLRPGMFVNARLASPAKGRALAVPRNAVLHSGTRTIVYVAKGDGVFEGREVGLGAGAGEHYPVLAGLDEGEHVVTNGNFLIDSQTRITGGMSGMFGGSREFENGQKPQVKANGEKLDISFQVDPDPPKGGGEATFHVKVADSTGKPVSDAQVRVTLIMPAMPSMNMPEMRAAAELKWSGTEYVGSTTVPMAGPWNVVIEVSRAGQALGRHRSRLVAR